jgi:hypothetical protein
MSVQIEIKSRPGTFITLDADVAGKIGHWGWCLRPDGRACAHILGSGSSRTMGKNVLLARAVIWAVTGQWPEKDKHVDHINHDVLDNQISNLRMVIRSQNMRNMLKHKVNSSKYYGVIFDKRRNNWHGRSHIRTEGKGAFIISSCTPDEVLAATAADCIRDLIGGFLPRNFPELSFLEKWKSIGEPQRRQIFRSMAKNNVPIYDNTIFIEQKAA